MTRVKNGLSSPLARGGGAGQGVGSRWLALLALTILGFLSRHTGGGRYPLPPKKTTKNRAEQKGLNPAGIRAKIPKKTRRKKTVV